MLSKIIEIGQKLAKFDLDSPLFIQECANSLKSLETNLSLSEFSTQLGSWILNNPLPEQLNVYNSFGQPPVTLYRNDKFLIDIYFWMHADTSIHSHAFCGAFKVLYGNSLHEEFHTEQRESYSTDTILNKLTRTKTNILVPGSVMPIERGEEFIHRVVHLSAPTVTLCIRTVADTDIAQWHHFDNGLSILKKELDESIFKKLFYGDYLFNLTPKLAQNYTRKFIKSLDNSELMNFFEQLSVDTMGVSDDYQELIYNTMMSRLSSQAWFHLYEEHCERFQYYSQEQAPDKLPDELSKFLFHSEFYEYSEDEVKMLTQRF